MRILVIGANGFVGPHLCRELEERGDEVVRLYGPGGSQGHEGPVVNVCDADAVKQAVDRANVAAVVHLAGVSSVAESHKDPAVAYEVNVIGALNVCLAVRASKPGVRLLFVSSGEVYGALAAGQPATEEMTVAPSSPYAASKVAAETVCLQFARSYGLHVVCARPFNHLGAGQAPHFAIPSFARQLRKARDAHRAAEVMVGDLSPVRDFSHVRDVVAAYRLLVDKGVSGETYNVGSGHGRSIRSVLDELIELAGCEAEVQVDPAKLRPVEIPWLVGNSAKIRALGWSPRWTVRDALTDVLADMTGS